MTQLTLRRPVWLALAVALVPSTARAQAVSFPELPDHIKAGNTVSIVEPNGERITGKIADLTSSSLTLLLEDGKKKTFPEVDVRRIVVRDSRRNGALIGLAAGAIPGAILGFWARAACEGEDACAALMPLVSGAFYGGIGAAIGAGIDGVINKTIDVSRQQPASLTVAPVVGLNRQGMLVSIRF